MRVLFVSYEVYPLAKVGGLADVAGSLPKALKELGLDIDVLMPFHGSVQNIGIENTGRTVKTRFIKKEYLRFAHYRPAESYALTLTSR